MNQEFKVSLENIIPLTYARDHFSGIVAEVQKNKMYILTKGGKPAIALIDVRYLEQLTAGGINKEALKRDIEKIPPEQIGMPKMVQHTPTPREYSGQVFRPLKPVPKPAGFAAPASTRDSSLGGPQPPSPPKPEIPEILQKPPDKPEPPSITAPAVPDLNVPKTSSKADIPFGGGAPLAPPPPPPIPPPPPKPAAPAPTNPKVDIQYTPDENPDEPQGSPNSALAPDDKVQPAQYDGEKDTEEPEEMPLD